MDLIKNVQTILGILFEHLDLIIAIIVGIFSLIGLIFTNKFKNNNKISQTNKKTNKIP